MEAEARCPYCQTGLRAFPQRGEICHRCFQKFYVRTISYNPRKTYLLTIAELAAWEKEQKDISYFHYWVRKLHDAGIPPETMEKIKKESAKISFSTMAWRAFSDKSHAMSAMGDLLGLKILYTTMAQFAIHEGLSPFRFLQSAIQADLRVKAREGQGLQTLVKIQAMIAGPKNSYPENWACPACAQQNGMIYSIQEAIASMPIPHKSCTKAEKGAYPLCRCQWVLPPGQTKNHSGVDFTQGRGESHS